MKKIIIIIISIIAIGAFSMSLVAGADKCCDQKDCICSCGEATCVKDGKCSCAEDECCEKVKKAVKDKKCCGSKPETCGDKI